MHEPRKGIVPGLYRIHWNEGGSSVAAVGVSVDGTNWLAPTNWVGGSCTDWSMVKSVERIDEKPTAATVGKRGAGTYMVTVPAGATVGVDGVEAERAPGHIPGCTHECKWWSSPCETCIDAESFEPFPDHKPAPMPDEVAEAAQSIMETAYQGSRDIGDETSRRMGTILDALTAERASVKRFREYRDEHAARAKAFLQRAEKAERKLSLIMAAIEPDRLAAILREDKP